MDKNAFAAAGGAKTENAPTESELNKLQGEGGPNATPAYGKQAGGLDENAHLTTDSQIADAKAGAEASSAGATQGGTDFNIGALVAAQHAGDEVPEGHEDTTQYSSHPIMTLRIGDHTFEGGLLRLKNGEEADKFEAMLATGDAMTQRMVKKIDRAGGVAVAKEFKARQGTMNQGVDTSDHGTRSPAPSAA